MRSVAFRPIPAVGGGLLPERNLPLDRFIYQLHLLLDVSNPRRAFPPLSVLNAFLSTGREDHGMSGGTQWEPFEIGPREYVEAVAALRVRDGYDLTPPPSWVKSPADWYQWRYQATHGYTPEEARRFRSGAPEDPVRTALDDELMTVAKSYSDAQRVGDEGAIRASEQALSKLLERANLE
jgi:hypothetical protein